MHDKNYENQKYRFEFSIGGVTLMATKARGQEMSEAEHERMDSLETAYKKDKEAGQKVIDARKMSDLKAKNRDARVKSKEAQRVEREPRNAAKASRKALNAEKKAQRLRRTADLRIEKANNAREKSATNK